MSEQKPIHIVGAGSIGSLFACYLQQAGHHPIFITKDRDGELPVVLKNSRGVLHHTIQACTMEKAHSLHTVIVCVKAWQLQPVLSALAEKLPASSTVLLIQNGMGHEKLAWKLLPKANIVVGTITHGAHRGPSGEVIHAGVGELLIGESSKQDLNTQRLFNALSGTWLTPQWVGNIHARMWRKLAVNATLNPLTVVFNCKNGEVLTNSEAREMLEALCDEVSKVLEKAGQPHQRLFERVASVAEATADNVSSMLQDWRAGNMTEIESITGYLLEVAATHHLKLPLNNELYQRLKKPLGEAV